IRQSFDEMRMQPSVREPFTCPPITYNECRHRRSKRACRHKRLSGNTGVEQAQEPCNAPDAPCASKCNEQEHQNAFAARSHMSPLFLSGQTSFPPAGNEFTCYVKCSD